MAVATGAMVLFRLLGSATGVALGGTILNNQLDSRLSNIQNFQPVNLEGNVQDLILLDPPELRDQVLSAYALYICPFLTELIIRSIRMIWIVMTPLSAVGLVCVLFMRKYTLKRNFVKAGDRPGSSETATAEGKTAPNETEISQSAVEEEKITQETNVESGVGIEKIG